MELPETYCCKRCNVVLPISAFIRTPGGFRRECRKCHYTRRVADIRAYRHKHPAKVATWKRQEYLARREEILAQLRKQRVLNPAYLLKVAVWRKKLRKAVLAAYGGKCTCCGEATYEFLTIDHVNNDGAADRKAGRTPASLPGYLKRNGYPAGYQVLCYNCNNAKAYHGRCPHQNENQ